MLKSLKSAYRIENPPSLCWHTHHNLRAVFVRPAAVRTPYQNLAPNWLTCYPRQNCRHYKPRMCPPIKIEKDLEKLEIFEQCNNMEKKQ
jgi:hypothetical protein